MMFEKVIIAEDHEIANLSLRRTLEELDIPWPDHAYYCDFTLAKIQKAQDIGQPYDLLITDLSFEVDGNTQQLADGAALIRAAKAMQPGLKILVFSAESRPAVIRSLFEELAIDGFVRKARGDAQELKTALERISQHRRYHPRELRTDTTQQNLHVFTDYDKMIIRLLTEGKSQKAISDYLSAHGIFPSGLSSVEKRLNLIRTAMGFSKNEQMVAFCKEMEII
jgi:two-component system capsular synthesis response regulator RcsB